jgi:hypothetical protein
MLELLRHPTPELSYTLKDVIAVFIWEYGSYCGVPYRSSRACLMMELLFTLNADNGQIFLWIGLEIGLVSRGSFR